MSDHDILDQARALEWEKRITPGRAGFANRHYYASCGSAHEANAIIRLLRGGGLRAFLIDFSDNTPQFTKYRERERLRANGAPIPNPYAIHVSIQNPEEQTLWESFIGGSSLHLPPPDTGESELKTTWGADIQAQRAPRVSAEPEEGILGEARALEWSTKTRHGKPGFPFQFHYASFDSPTQAKAVMTALKDLGLGVRFIDFTTDEADFTTYRQLERMKAKGSPIPNPYAIEVSILTPDHKALWGNFLANTLAQPSAAEKEATWGVDIQTQRGDRDPDQLS